MNDLLSRAAEVLARGGVVAFTGAGISAESGIPTFRDPGGIWDRYSPMRFGTLQGIAREAVENPSDLADYLTEMKAAFAEARPNPGHLALAELERAGLLTGVITQNVDGLHREAGTTELVEIHGSHARRRCLACGHVRDVTRQEYVAGVEGTVAALRRGAVTRYEDVLPRCVACEGPARPDVVAFGEAVKDFHRAERLAEQARCLLVVGTSGEVYPAASLPDRARACGAVVVEVAPEETSIDADIRLRGRAGEVLPELARLAVARAPSG